MTEEEKLNREIELVAYRTDMQDDYRLIKYRLKTDSFIKRLLSKKGYLKRAYLHFSGMTDHYSADEYKQLKRELKTYGDVEKYLDEQYAIAKAKMDIIKSKWNDAD